MYIKVSRLTSTFWSNKICPILCIIFIAGPPASRNPDKSQKFTIKRQIFSSFPQYQSLH